MRSSSCASRFPVSSAPSSAGSPPASSSPGPCPSSATTWDYPGRSPTQQAAEKGPSASLAPAVRVERRLHRCETRPELVPHAQRTASTPRVWINSALVSRRPEAVAQLEERGAASHLDLFERPAGFFSGLLADRRHRFPRLAPAGRA